MTPKLSVVMPVYNGGKYLKEAIESILSQTLVDFEFVIIDDGSSDNSVQIVESYSDERIRLIKNNHQGLVKSLNIGIENSGSEYIVRMDSDDVAVPERLEKLFNYMENNPGVAVCGSWANIINETGEKVGEMKYPLIENKVIKKYNLLHCPFIHPTVIFRRDIIKRLGGYKNFKHAEDYELWTRVLNKNLGHNLPEKLIDYRIHSNQVTKKVNLKMRFSGIVVRFLALIRY